MEGSVGGVEEIVAKLHSLGNSIAARAYTRMGKLGADLVGEAVDHAPWHDRTGHARASIHADVYANSDVIGINFGMGSTSDDYPKWLEVAHGGKYRIIDPTTNGTGRIEMMALMGDLLDG